MTNVRPKGRRRSLLVLAAVLVLAAGGATYFLITRAAEPAQTVAQGPSTQPIVLAPHQVVVAGPGTLDASTSLNLSVAAGLSGRIASVAAVGDRVEVGAELARLDPTGFERALNLAQFALERAQAQLGSLKSSQAQAEAAAKQQHASAQAAVDTAQRALDAADSSLTLTQHLQGIGAESEDSLRTAQTTRADAQRALDVAQSDLGVLIDTQALQASARKNDLTNSELSVSQAELDVEQAQADLASLTVTAPFAGVVSAVNVVVGASVNDSTNLLTLIDDSSLALDVQIDETQVGKIAKGQTATATLDALPGQTFTGTVTSVSPVARLESNIAIFDVIVTLPNQGLVLRPGMTAEADIVVKNVPEALSVPSQAVMTGRQGSSIMAVTADGKTEARPVEVVETVGFQTFVTGDFSGATEVVLPGAATATTRSTNETTGQQGLRIPGVGFGGGAGGFGGGAGGAVRQPQGGQTGGPR